MILLQEKLKIRIGRCLLPPRLGAPYCDVCDPPNQSDGNRIMATSLRESQLLPRNRRGKRVIGCRQRAESTQRVRPGYETDVLTEFPARLELRANRGANHLVDIFQ